MNRSILFACSLSLFASGCISFGSRRARTASHASAAGYRGPVTFTNRSALRVCTVEALFQGNHYVRVDRELGAGASATFEAPENLTNLWVTECGGARTLFGRSPRVQGAARLAGLTHGAIALYDPGAAPADGGDHHAIAADPEPMAAWHASIATIWYRAPSDAMNGASVRDESMAALRAYSQGRGDRDTFLTLRVLSQEWNIERNNLQVVVARSFTAAVTARMPQGYCQAYGATLYQPAVGSGFEPRIRSRGSSMNIRIPCTLAEWAATQGEWAH